jgi:hypothetical protein
MPSLSPIERRAFEYTALEEAMAHLDAVVRPNFAPYLIQCSDKQGDCASM